MRQTIKDSKPLINKTYPIDPFGTNMNSEWDHVSPDKLESLLVYETLESGISWEKEDSQKADIEQLALEFEQEPFQEKECRIVGVQISGHLSSEDRAWQKAQKFAEELDLDKEHEEVLFEIFLENPYGPTMSAIRKILSSDISLDGLKLVWSVRKLFAEYPEFSNGKAAPASWKLAKAIIDYFDSNPDLAEVERLILELYEKWRYKTSIFRQFRTFITFVTYCFKYNHWMLELPV